MDPVGGWTTVAVAGSSLCFIWTSLRRRLSQRTVDLLSALCGAVGGVGGLLLLYDVGITSWIVGPAVLAAVLALHAHALFADEGPLRT
jgi:hypothetical protein